jgi:hypothetical protein
MEWLIVATVVTAEKGWLALPDGHEVGQAEAEIVG